MCHRYGGLKTCQCQLPNFYSSKLVPEMASISILFRAVVDVEVSTLTEVGVLVSITETSTTNGTDVILTMTIFLIGS